MKLQKILPSVVGIVAILMCFVIYNKNFLLRLSCDGASYDIVWEQKLPDDFDATMFVLETADGLYIAVLENKAFLWTGHTLDALSGDYAAAGISMYGEHETPTRFYVMAEYKKDGEYPQGEFIEQDFRVTAGFAGDGRIWVAYCEYYSAEDFGTEDIWQYLF